MATCSLTLAPFSTSAFTVDLLENDIGRSYVERIINHAVEGNSVFSDLSYVFTLNSKDIDTIQDVRVYINDTYEQSVYSNGTIRFPSRGIGDRKIFIDCYGFVEIGLTLILVNGTRQFLTSGYLPVLVRRGLLNESVKQMVSYVYEHQESLLLNGEPKPKNLSGFKEDGYKSLTSQIILAEEIATLYEGIYGYFKANSRFRIEKTPRIDQFERLQYVTPATLEYIASHPEQLTPITAERGIRVGGRIYQPQKTLSLQNVNSCDIYENRVVLGFLRKMVDEVEQLRLQCDTLLQQIPQDESYSADYIYSSFFMFAETRHTLENGINQLSSVHDRFIRLCAIYQSALQIPIEKITGEPKPTPIFLSIPQYNKVFVRIHQWFSYGVYSFEKERLMLSFVKISSLYESYLLVKLISYFSSRGYALIESKRCTYPVASSWKYQNTRCANTFIFTNEKKTMTLYYQPVVFDTDRRKVNGIGLYRNNSLSAYSGEDDARRGGHYYTPDYIVKLDTDGRSKYLILDAKFSDINSVKTYHVKDLAFKYLFSISPIETNDSVLGMSIIYGKCAETAAFESAYDKQISTTAVSPIADLVPLIEGIAVNEHTNKLDQLFRKLWE